MFGWLRELLEIRAEFRERLLRLDTEASHDKNICSSCEILKEQLAIANIDREKLLARLVDKPETPKDEPPIEITKPRVMPWRVKRQLLEAEDREKARVLRQAPKPDDVSDLEKELGIVEAERNALRTGNE